MQEPGIPRTSYESRGGHSLRHADNLLQQYFGLWVDSGDGPPMRILYEPNAPAGFSNINWPIINWPIREGNEALFQLHDSQIEVLAEGVGAFFTRPAKCSR